MKIFFNALMLLLLIPVTVCLAQETDDDHSLEGISTQLYKIEADIEDERFLLPKLDDYLAKLPRFTAEANKCITNTGSQLADIKDRKTKLGKAADDEPSDVAFIRRSLTSDRIDLVNRQSSCKAVLVRSETAIKNISKFRTKNLERKSFDRGDNILTVVQGITSERKLSETRLATLLQSSRGIKVLNEKQLVMLLSILALVTAISLYIRYLLSRWDSKSLARWQHQHLNKTDTGTRFVAATLVTVRRYILSVLVSTSLAIYIVIETHAQVPTPLITIITYGLPILFLAFALIYFTFIALPNMGLREDIKKTTLSSLRFRLAVLATVIYLGNLLFQSILSNSLNEDIFFLARAILGLVLVLNVIWVLWLTRGIEGIGSSTPARALTSLLLIGALAAELTGYRNLSGFVIQGVIGTLIAFTFLQTFSYVLKRFLDEINQGVTTWQQRLRVSIGVKEGASIPGFLWIRFISLSAIWLLFFLALLFSWDVPGADIQQFTSAILQGFNIGSFKIIPIKIIEAIIVLVVLLALNSWFQKQLEKKFLTKVGIERGARESISTISNYIGIALIIIIALAVIGMDFSKLAIIAGALSVGIGFGLQNVVNNFVSGLILLFERPIKTGDWILAGGVEGTVKNISIRTTLIQSFDGADIIIPNSVLISDNLTNWELKQNHGRVRVPIGVAYGSDTEKVKKLLLKVASEHEAAISGNYKIPDPQVMFLSFGDNSLDFELRFFIKDIKRRIHVISELNFAIDSTFRENDIEIPFPQRDIHIVDKDSGKKELDED